MRDGLRRLWFGVLAVALAAGTAAPAWVGLAEAAATPAPTRPQAPLKLTTSPLPVILNTKPGTTVSTDIKIKQSGGDTERLKVNLMKFGAMGETGKPSLNERGPNDDYFDWVSFDKPTFTAPNDVWQTVRMTIHVPKTAAFSYYYAVVFSREGDDLSPGGNRSGIAGGTAVLVMLGVDTPGAKRSLKLESFSVKHRIVEFLPAEFTATVVNDGNLFVRPSGNVFISQGDRQVGLLMFNEEMGTVLSNSKRQFNMEWDFGFPYYDVARQGDKDKLDKNGQPVMALHWGLPSPPPSTEATSTVDEFNQKQSHNPLTQIRFGKYTAHLFATYQDGNNHDIPVESTVSFWVIPWRALLVALVILLIIGFGAYSSFSNAWGWARAGRRGRRR